MKIRKFNENNKVLYKSNSNEENCGCPVCGDYKSITTEHGAFESEGKVIYYNCGMCGFDWFGSYELKFDRNYTEEGGGIVPGSEVPEGLYDPMKIDTKKFNL